MKNIKLIIICVIFTFISINTNLFSDNEVVFAICRPLESQIKNIEQLYEKDIITLKKIKLICIYHENEVTDYTSSFEYVKRNKLQWVEFKKIKGMVALKNLFKKNKWTEQFKEIFDSTNGIIFTGGEDLPPVIYNQENNLVTVACTPIRSMYEVSFLFHLIGGNQNLNFIPFLESRNNYTVLGVCLGAQSMNVAAGGTLYQDIPSEIYGLKTIEQVLKLGQDRIHSSIYLKRLNPVEENLAPVFHRINLEINSIFLRKMSMDKKDLPFVLSSHHQAVNRLGKGLVIAAISMDGKVIEAVEHKKYKNVLGVQFHPESYLLYKKGVLFKRKPEHDRNFNLRDFLKKNYPSMKFHINLWKWFSESLKYNQFQ